MQRCRTDNISRAISAKVDVGWEDDLLEKLGLEAVGFDDAGAVWGDLDARAYFGEGGRAFEDDDFVACAGEGDGGTEATEAAAVDYYVESLAHSCDDVCGV